MLIKSSPWRSEIIKLVTPLSYHEAFVNKIRKIKTLVRNNENKDVTQDKNSANNNALQPRGRTETTRRAKEISIEKSKSAKRRNLRDRNPKDDLQDSIHSPNKSSGIPSTGMMRLKRICSGMFAMTGQNVEVHTL